MADKRYDEEDGVWRTIRGRRVFIRDGEDLESAMKRSGKFKTKFSPEEVDELKNKRNKINPDGKQAKAREIDKVNKISQEEYDKMPKDYKGTLKELVDTAEFRGENKEELKSFYEKQGYDVDKDKTILKYDNGGTVLQPVKIESNNIKAEDLQQGTPYTIDYGNDIKKTAIFAGKDENGNNMFYDGEGVNGSFALSDKFINERNMVSKNEDDETFINLYNQVKNTEEQTIPREKAQAFVKAFKTALEEEQNGYTQTVDWDGGTYEYSKDRLERMEQSGIKPLEHSYTGGGWQGTKYDSKLTTKEIAKTVQDDLKKNYPGVKISRKTDYNSIDINIMSSDKDLYKTGFDIDRMDDKTVSDTIRDSIGGYTRMDDWLNKNNRKNDKGAYTVKDQKDYLKEELETYRNRQGSRVSGGEWYLSDYGKEVVGSLNKNLNSYNYDDSDGMVDYFDTNFYGGVQIGKWDKPFVVEDKKIEAKIERYKKRKNK